MSWAPLPWQRTAWEKLLSAAAADRLPHAWLLTGPAGTGKRHFARGMAELLLQEPASPAAAQQLLAAGHHPDLIRLSPEPDKRQISVESLRDAMERLTLSSHRGGRRVLLIEPAEALNESGVNALLKTLEEPPASAHLVLVTERLMSLKPTLRSRCQILRPGQPTPEQGRAWLQRECPSAPLDAIAPFELKPLLAPRELESGNWDPRGWRELLSGLAAALARIETLSLKDHKQQLLPCLRWLMQEAMLEQRNALSGRERSGSSLGRLSARALSDWMLMAAQVHRALSGQTTINARLLLESLMIGLYERASARA